jgi:hypothetical protein
LTREHLGQSHGHLTYARFYLAKALSSLKRQDDARSEYTELRQLTYPFLTVAPIDTHAQFCHAWALLQDGTEEDTSEALEQAQAGLDSANKWPRHGRQPHLYLAKAVAQWNLGEADRAIKTLCEGLQIDFDALHRSSQDLPRTRWELEVTLAQFLVEQDDVDGAINVHLAGIAERQEKLTAEPTSAELLPIALAKLRFGIFLREQEKYKQAEDYLVDAQQMLSSNDEAAEASRVKAAEQLKLLHNVST